MSAGRMTWLLADYHDKQARYGGASREWHERSAAHVRSQTETIRALAVALDRFGRHDSGCLTKKNPGCACGLNDALRLTGRLP